MDEEGLGTGWHGGVWAGCSGGWPSKTQAPTTRTLRDVLSGPVRMGQHPELDVLDSSGPAFAGPPERTLSAPGVGFQGPCSPKKSKPTALQPKEVRTMPQHTQDGNPSARGGAGNVATDHRRCITRNECASSSNNMGLRICKFGTVEQSNQRLGSLAGRRPTVGQRTGRWVLGVW